MKVVFDIYNHDEAIPVQNYLPDKKLKKYFNRETAAAITAMGKLLNNRNIDTSLPVYYATGLLEYQDYGLNDIVSNSRSEDGKFSQKYFVEKAIPLISPLNQFKILQNMPLSFISIVFRLTGDNAVIYSSASGLLRRALYSPQEKEILIGAGKVYSDGKVESGFALINKDDLRNNTFLRSNAEAVEIFRNWKNNIL